MQRSPVRWTARAGVPAAIALAMLLQAMPVTGAIAATPGTAPDASTDSPGESSAAMTKTGSTRSFGVLVRMSSAPERRGRLDLAAGG